MMAMVPPAPRTMTVPANLQNPSVLRPQWAVGQANRVLMATVVVALLVSASTALMGGLELAAFAAAGAALAVLNLWALIQLARRVVFAANGESRGKGAMAVGLLLKTTLLFGGLGFLLWSVRDSIPHLAACALGTSAPVIAGLLSPLYLDSKGIPLTASELSE